MNLKNLTPDVDLSEKEVEIPDINRPALQLTGFFEHFDSERVQIIGYVEYTFLEKMTDEVKKKKIYETLLSYKIPCLIFCRNLPPEAMLLEMAEKANIPVFQTEKKTSEFTAEIIRWLNVELAPCISIHGVLVDVYGVGVLIMGESGIGKSKGATFKSLISELRVQRYYYFLIPPNFFATFFEKNQFFFILKVPNVCLYPFLLMLTTR